MYMYVFALGIITFIHAEHLKGHTLNTESFHLLVYFNLQILRINMDNIEIIFQIPLYSHTCSLGTL